MNWVLYILWLMSPVTVHPDDVYNFPDAKITEHNYYVLDRRLAFWTNRATSPLTDVQERWDIQASLPALQRNVLRWHRLRWAYITSFETSRMDSLQELYDNIGPVRYRLGLIEVMPWD